MKRGAKMALLRSVNDGDQRDEWAEERNHERRYGREYRGYDRGEREHRRDDRRYRERGGDDWDDEDEREHERREKRRMIHAGGTFWMDNPEAGQETRPMDEAMAVGWVKKMKNADGSTGEHFTRAQSEQYRQSICPQCGSWAYYAALNMIYSDYCEAAKKLGVDKPEFYAHMARAFLEDQDAGKDKIEKYMRYIAGK